MFDAVTKSISQIVSLSPEELQQLFERLIPLNIPKDGFLIREGHICQSVYFINQGNFRHFTIDDNGIESTLDLFIQHEWVLEYKSFLTQQPSLNIIQATADSELLALHVGDIHALAKISDKFFRLGVLLERGTHNQDFQNNRLTPEQKYEKLLNTRPGLLQHFPLKYIASYMSITPETLSRVRLRFATANAERNGH